MSKNKFCPLPWYNITTDVNGSIRPCCRYAQPEPTNANKNPNQPEHPMPWMQEGSLKELWNGKEFKKLRQAFIDGETPVECNWCWKEESNGVLSYRQKYIKYHKHYFEGIDFSSTTSKQPLVLDLKLSNVCNLKCRMCSPVASSSILKEIKKSTNFSSKELIDHEYWLSNKILGTDNEKDFISWLPNIRKIELTGGEPLVSIENRQLLEYISKTEYAKNIDLDITTNASYYNTKFIESLKSFKRVKICCSIDDIGNRLSYARHGSDWALISNNLLKYKQHTEFVVNIWATVNNYNVWYLDELIDFANEKNVEIAMGPLHSPEELSIQYLPDYVKERIVSKYITRNKDMAVLDPILRFLEASNENNIEAFLAFTKTFDIRRDEKFIETFKEWRDVIYYG